MLGVNRSGVFRENPEEIGPCVWLACLNSGVEIEAGTISKDDGENYNLYLLNLFKSDNRSCNQKVAIPPHQTYPNKRIKLNKLSYFCTMKLMNVGVSSF